MKKNIICVLLSFFAFSIQSIPAFSQGKPIIDESALNAWETLGPVSLISKTGKFVVYSVFLGKKEEFFLQDIGTKAKYKLKDRFNKFRFIGDDYLAIQRKDSLFVSNLPKLDFKFVGLASQNRIGGNDRSLELIYHEKSKDENYLTVRVNLKTGARRTFVEQRKETITPVIKTDAQGINSLWMPDNGGKLQKLVDDEKLQGQQGLKISSVNGVSEIGTVRLTLASVAKIENKKASNYMGPTLWSYTDSYIQSVQQNRPLIIQYAQDIKYSAIVVKNGKEIIRLDDKDYEASQYGESSWIIRKRRLDFIYGIQQPTKLEYLVSEIDGLRTKLVGLETGSKSSLFYVTRDCQFFVYFDGLKGDYYSYNLRNKETINLTSKTQVFAEPETDGIQLVLHPDLRYNNRTPHVLPNEDFLTTDGFDFWRIDPRGRKAPLCVTAHFGRTNNIVFETIPEVTFSGDLSGDPKVLLSGFDPKTKKRGLFEVSLASSRTPKKIAFEDASFLWHTSSNGNRIPIKASGADIWLFQMCTANRSPNLFISDGKSVKQVTHIQPEKDYNWLTTELLSWKTSKGVDVQGILYKPENLDPAKKYPVIINFYEEQSDDLHLFHKPALMKCGDIDIPTMVSRGYLVFVPDMKYRLGEVLASALECLESGTDELCKRPYADQSHIGLSGHSHGGYESVYFVTRSNRYKAVLIGAPVTNNISWYNISTGLRPNPHNNIEKTQTRMVSSLWEHPEWYIQNSAVFYADKVQTPVLLMHNTNDIEVPFSQGAEFFLSLTRLGKPAWMLDYEKEGHLVKNVENQKDLTTRSQQFFDHYLKGAPAPIWMLEGIPYKKRGYKTGLELDTLGRTPGKSPLITETEQKKIDEYSKLPLRQKLRTLKD